MAVEQGTDVVPVRAGVLGTGTGMRFALLLVFITVGSLSLLGAAAASGGDGGWDWFVLCSLATGVDPRQPYVSSKTVTNSAFIQSCQAAHGVRSPVEWMVIGTGAVLVLAALIFLMSPTWRRRRGRLLPIDLTSADELALQLRELVIRAGLPRPPEFVIDLRASTASAVVFGRLGRYTVSLDAGLIKRSGTDPGVLSAVVLHELAHIRNRDVDITYATVALWRAFLICALLPYLVGAIYPLAGQAPFAVAAEIWRDQWQLQSQSIVRAMILVAFTYLVRSDILRTREFYADADAAHRAGQAAMSWPDQRPPARPGPAAWQRFLSVWRTHPGWLERNRSLADPSILFGAAALPMFLTGVTAEVANSTIPVVFQAFGLLSPSGLLAELPTWLAAAVVVGIAGYALWRAVGYAVLTHRTVPSGWLAGFWLGTGMAVGELVTFRTAGDGLLPPDPAILLAFVAGGPVFTWWVAQCAELWIRGCRGRSIKPVQFLGLAAALVAFGTWYSYWMTELVPLLFGVPSTSQFSALAPGGTAAWYAGTPGWFAVVTLLADKPLVFAGAAVLWLFPLIALLRGPVPQTPAWVRRVRPATPDNPAMHATPSLRPAAAAAVLGGALCCLAVVLVMTGLHPSQPPPEGRNASWALTYWAWLTVGQGAATALTAIVVSSTLRRQQLTMALAAAGGAALIGLAGLFVLAASDGCIRPMQVMASTCAWRPQAAWSVVTPQVPFVLGLVIYLAAIGALASAVLVHGGRRIAGWRRGMAPRETTPRSQPGPRIIRRLVVLTASGLTAALAVNTAASYWRNIDIPATPAVTLGHEPPQTADTIKLEVGAWLKVGGNDEITKLGGDFRRESLAAITAAKQASGQGSVSADSPILAPFLPICAAIVRDAGNAKLFPPIPDGQAQAAWAKVLTDAARSGANCQRGLRHDDGALFTKSFTEGTAAAVTAYSVLLKRLGAIANSP